MQLKRTQEIDELFIEAEEEQRRFLRASGWTQSSSHPGSRILFSKRFKFYHGGKEIDREYHLPQQLAWSFQRDLEAFEEEQ